MTRCTLSTLFTLVFAVSIAGSAHAEPPVRLLVASPYEGVRFELKSATRVAPPPLATCSEPCFIHVSPGDYRLAVYAEGELDEVVPLTLDRDTYVWARPADPDRERQGRKVQRTGIWIAVAGAAVAIVGAVAQGLSGVSQIGESSDPDCRPFSEDCPPPESSGSSAAVPVGLTLAGGGLVLTGIGARTRHVARRSTLRIAPLSRPRRAERASE